MGLVTLSVDNIRKLHDEALAGRGGLTGERPGEAVERVLGRVDMQLTFDVICSGSDVIWLRRMLWPLQPVIRLLTRTSALRIRP